MALQNRVTPTGEIIATTARGTIMGNRGILHDENKQVVRMSRNSMWLICRLEFKGRKRDVMSPGTYTELFFLDEAVALAAGHRPCGECRRIHYQAFIAAANAHSDNPLRGSKELDKRLHESRRKPLTTAPIATLPDGVFIMNGDDDLRLVWNGALHRWSPEGYVDPLSIAEAGTEMAVVVTPSLSVSALRHGYPVEVHPSIGPSASQDLSEVIPSLESTINFAEEPTMSALTPELHDEIKRHLRVNPVRHGEVFRAMEQGLDVDQMGTSRANAQTFKNSVEAMLQGILPATRSAALTNSYGYRYLLGCDISPGLLSHSRDFLRQLASINPEVRTDEPLHIRALPNTKARRSPLTAPPERVCLRCNLAHAGECD
jgi:hypothetical protein